MAESEATERDGPFPVTHGRVSYLQIPALDAMRSAAFYEAVFGWRIERPYPSFEAPGLIGQWVTDRAPVADGGLLAWIHVDGLEASLELVAANGGEVVEPPSSDGPTRRLATVRDPAGNAVGLVQHDAG